MHSVKAKSNEEAVGGGKSKGGKSSGSGAPAEEKDAAPLPRPKWFAPDTTGEKGAQLLFHAIDVRSRAEA